MTAETDVVDRAAQLLDARIGLKPDVSFRPRLIRALRDVASSVNVDTAELVGSLATDAARMDALVNRVTVQESGFFRHPEHFEILARRLLPSMKPPLRAWSAACANGQEAYSLAMVISETGRQGSVFASDVSPAALQRTSSGSYMEREMGGVSAERRRQHFAATGNRWQARQELREMLTVDRHNLLDPIPPEVATCQVIMCRNVLIYFKQHHAREFLGRLADVMHPTARLFAGAAETLWQLTDRFEPVEVGSSYVFRPVPHGSRVRTADVAKPPVKAPAPRHVPVRGIAGRSRPVPVQRPANEVVQAEDLVSSEVPASGLAGTAIIDFRRSVFLSPDDPTAHFQLGSALDAVGESASARRAYRAALAALDRSPVDGLAELLHGYDPSELRRLLVDRCRAVN